MADALVLEDLRKSFGGVRAVDGLSLRIPERCVYGLIGPNGAGKTTLFGMICGFLHPTGGSGEVLGTDLAHIGELTGRIGTLPQDAQFQRNVPIKDQLVFFLRLSGYDRDQAEAEVLAALDRVGLGEVARRRAGALSHGMGKRLALAQAFLGRPELVLLDEPTAGLDPAQARSVCELITEMGREATVVVSSHNLGQLEIICERVAVMDRGRLIAEGRVEDLVRRGRSFRIAFARPPGSAVLEELRALPGVASCEPEAPAACRIDLAPEAESEAVLAGALRRLLDAGHVPQELRGAATLENEVLALLEGREGTDEDLD